MLLLPLLLLLALLLGLLLLPLLLMRQYVAREVVHATILTPPINDGGIHGVLLPGRTRARNVVGLMLCSE